MDAKFNIHIHGYENIAENGTDFNGGDNEELGIFKKKGVFTREGFDLFFVYKEADGKVIVHYMDVTDPENPVEIDREEATGKVSDDNYTTIVKDIENYTLVEKEEPQVAQTVTFKEDTIEITYEYIKNKGVVNVYYMDVTDPENPVEMDSDVIDNQYVDSEYRTTEKTFEHFTLVETPANATGTVKGTPTNVIYNYVRNVGKVIVHYMDVTDPENPVEMATEEYSGKVALEDETEPDTYTTEAKTFTHYELIDPKEDYTGTFAEDTLDLIYSYVWRDGQVTVHYMDVTDPENPVEIISDDTEYGAVDSSYEVTPQTHEELTNYTLVGDSGNRVGVYTENAIEVYFNYIKKIGSVIVYHIDADTNEEIVTNETLTGYIGDEYESSSLENIDPYVLVEPLPENANGTYTEDEQTVTYYYKKRSGVVEVYYKDLYTGKVIEGQEVKEMPGYVDEQYTVEIPTIEGYEYVRAEPEELLTGNYPDGIVEKITLYYQKVGKVITHYYEVDTTNSVADDVETTGLIGTNYLTKPAENVEGYSLVATPENATGEYIEELQEIIYYYQRLGRIVTHFLDNNGNVLADPVEEFGVVGEEYTTTPVNIDGYELTGTPENATGEFAKEDIDVNYIYSIPTEPVEPEVKYGTVIVHYVDEDGNELIDAIPLVGEVGTEYRAPEIPIAGYTLIDAVRINNTRMLLRALPAGKPNVGLFEEVKFEINMVYSKDEDPIPETGKVVVLYTDTEGYTIADREEIPGNVGDEYITTQLRIDGYKISEVKGERRGTISAGTTYVEYIYEKVETDESSSSYDNNCGCSSCNSCSCNNCNCNNEEQPTIIINNNITNENNNDNSSNNSSTNTSASNVENNNDNSTEVNNENNNQDENNVTNENNPVNNNEVTTGDTNVENNVTTGDTNVQTGDTTVTTGDTTIENNSTVENNTNVETGDTTIENNPTNTVETGDTNVTTGDTNVENNTSVENNPTNNVENNTEVDASSSNENNNSSESNPTVTNTSESNPVINLDNSSESNPNVETTTSIENNPTNTNEANPTNNVDVVVDPTINNESGATNTNESNSSNNNESDPVNNNDGSNTNINENNDTNSCEDEKCDEKQEQDSTSTDKPKTGKVIVRYLDEEGYTISPTVTINGNVNDDYVTDQLRINGYEIDRVEGETEDSIKEEPTYVTYYYKTAAADSPKQGQVLVHYVDEEGKAIANDEVINGTVGEQYIAIEKVIAGYELLDVVKVNRAPVRLMLRALPAGSPNVGTITEELIELNFIYQAVEAEEEPSCSTCGNTTVIVNCDSCDKEDEQSQGEPKKGTVITYYFDSEGNTLETEETTTGKVDDEYQTSPKEIKGYKLLRVVGQPEGNYIQGQQVVIYIYQAENTIVEELGNLEVHHVDTDGNELAETETSTDIVGNPYQTNPKEILDYKVLRVDGDPEGTYVAGTTIVTYVYEKVTDEESSDPVQSKVIVNYVDINGKKISGRVIFIGTVGTEWKSFEKTIDGYYLVRVEGNTEGLYTTEEQEVTYVYESLNGEGNTDIEPEPTEPEAKPGKVDGATAEIQPPRTKVDKNLNSVYFLIVSLIYGLITYTKKRTN